MSYPALFRDMRVTDFVGVPATINCQECWPNEPFWAHDWTTAFFEASHNIYLTSWIASRYVLVTRPVLRMPKKGVFVGPCIYMYFALGFSLLQCTTAFHGMVRCFALALVVLAIQRLALVLISWIWHSQVESRRFLYVCATYGIMVRTGLSSRAFWSWLGSLPSPKHHLPFSFPRRL